MSNALIQTRIDADVKERASFALNNMGLTVSDAVRILLTRVANEGTLPVELLVSPDKHDEWFRKKVREALNDPRPDVDSETVKEHFAMLRRKAATRSNK